MNYYKYTNKATEYVCFNNLYFADNLLGTSKVRRPSNAESLINHLHTDI